MLPGHCAGAVCCRHLEVQADESPPGCSCDASYRDIPTTSHFINQYKLSVMLKGLGKHCPTLWPCDQRERDMSCFNMTNDCCWFGLIFFFFWNKVSCGPGWPPTPCVVRDAFVVEVLLPLTCAGFQACHNTQLLHDSRQTLHLVSFLSCPADYTAFSFVLLEIKMTFNPLALFIAYYKTREKFL